MPKPELSITVKAENIPEVKAYIEQLEGLLRLVLNGDARLGGYCDPEVGVVDTRFDPTPEQTELIKRFLVTDSAPNQSEDAT